MNWQAVQLDTFFYQLHTPYFWSSILTAFLYADLSAGFIITIV
ncbi:hypothetical protein [Staphylococcus aureus]